MMLKQLAANYPVGSLVWKAVEEEIKKLNDKFPISNDKNSGFQPEFIRLRRAEMTKKKLPCRLSANLSQ